MKKEKVEGKIGVVEWLIRKKMLLCILLIIAYAGSMLLIVRFIGKGKDTLEILYYVSQILSALFVIIGTAIAVIQYIFNSNTSKNEAEKQRKIEAARMADEFRKNVIPKISKLSVAYSNASLRENVIDYLDNSNLEHFDKEEVKRLFPDDLFLRYRIDVAKNYLLQTDKNFEELETKYRTDKRLTAAEKNELRKKLNEMVMDALQRVSNMCTELSNTLEYMCICFNTNIADDKTVYQSLHSVFFMAVHMIYIFTFDANVNEHDRLYYNIMRMYKRWKKINLEKKVEEENNRERMEEEVKALKATYNEKITVKTMCE